METLSPGAAGVKLADTRRLRTRDTQGVCVLLSIQIYNQPGFDYRNVKSIHAEVNKFTDDKMCHPEDIKRHPVNTTGTGITPFGFITCLLQSVFCIYSVKRRATREEVVEKFLNNAANTIGSVKAERIVELVDRYLPSDQVAELADTFVLDGLLGKGLRQNTPLDQ